MKPGAINAEGVSRRFRVYPQRNVTLKDAILRRRQLRREEIWALRDVSLAIEPGEAVGIVGRNGSGKTTLLRLIAGIFQPTGGRLEVAGEVGSLLGLGAGFHPDFTGRENVFMNGAIHGLSRSYVHERLEEIVSFAEPEEFFDVPVRTYSSGMYMRLGFALATHLDPDILLLDEVFAVGDEAFQRKCFGKILELRERGRTIVFVSHAAPAVERVCERAILLTSGRVAHDGASREVIKHYQQLLAGEEASAQQHAWGTGEATVVGVRLEGSDGEEQRQFLSGGPLAVRLAIELSPNVSPPRVAVEFRDANGGLLGASEATAEELGWETGRSREVCFEVPRLPLSDGLFQLSVALGDPHSTRQYHRLDSAAEFTVFPDEHSRGWFRFEGDWSLVAAKRPARTA
ncbi:MAG TPA: ABC transporter ATP-binding protein [Gaiellaceae bacterium]|nr:ABC transporter ATP-binding protein [Gaiellaceae bacterium]